MWEKGVYADIFTELLGGPDTELKSSVENDPSGFYYRSGVDLNTRPATNDPRFTARQNLSLGCSGFNFNTNFLKQFSTEALSNTLSSVATATMAAAPMLLLEYASPTLADIVKHFNAVTNVKLGLRYTQCEDIEKAVSGEFDKLRKKSEMECIKEQAADDIDGAMNVCKAQGDPFAFLKNKDGQPLYTGVEINILEDAMDRLALSAPEKAFIQNVLPEKTITADEVQNTEPDSGIEYILEERRDEILAELEVVLANYKASQTVSDTTLEQYSIPGAPLTEWQLKNISLLDDGKSYVSLATIASELSYYETLQNYEKALDNLKDAINNPEEDETSREFLQSLYWEAKEDLAAVKERREFLDNYKEYMSELITESEKKRLRLLAFDDGTQAIVVEEKENVDEKLLFLPE